MSFLRGIKRRSAAPAETRPRRTTPLNHRDETTANRKGLPLRNVSVIIIIVTILISGILLYVTFNTSTSVRRTNESMETYVRWYQAARDMQAASDYLTQHVQSFVVSGNVDWMDHYFEEANTARRREQALASLPESIRDTNAYRELETAMEHSLALMDSEYHAMALTCEAIGFPAAKRPDVVRNYPLTAAERAMTAEEKLEAAEEYVFGTAYHETKAKIQNATESCFADLAVLTREIQNEASRNTLRLLTVGEASILVMVGLLILILVFLFRLAIRPILAGTQAIKENRTIPVTGSKEFRHLASEYNALFDAMKDSLEDLSYEVAHDELTGLYNRAGYDALKKSATPADTALLVIDIDRFKSINDTYGHAIGDKALKRVAETLRDNFRAEDGICRIGGDEFAVLMKTGGLNLEKTVRDKTKRINEILHEPSGDIPPIALSVGAALGSGEIDMDEMFRHADRVLYEIKANGGNTCGFYRKK